MFRKFFYIMWCDRKIDFTRIIRKSFARYKRLGMKEVLLKLDKEYKILSKNFNTKDAYALWIKENENKEYIYKSLKVNPLISIITPVYNTEIRYLKFMFESVISQEYIHWELCITDDGSTSEETLNILKLYEKKDSRIKIVYSKINENIAQASNHALALAKGEYITFLDHDDMLSKNALYEMVKRLNSKSNLKFIYSDEDKIDKKNNRYEPHFKSGWNPDMFFSQNYISHLTLIHKDIIKKVQGFREGYNGSQDYDLYLRCLKNLKENEIDNIEKILYHWRAIKGSTALEHNAKPYTTLAGMRALKDYFKETKVKIEKGLLDNTYRVIYPISQKQPLVSLIIPTRDKYDILLKCITSILEYTTYTNYEILILDNETTDKYTLDYFESLKNYKHIKIIPYHHPFNYSAINNFGVKYAKGEVIGLINNDVEIISPHWLSEMVSHAIRPEIGAVGAMLYYENNTVQHAGVILGIGGVAGHSHKHFLKDDDGYFSRLKIVQNYSAVTGACLVVRKKLYLEVNGLDEKNLMVAFNDVDFCLKLQEKGYRNLWTPYVELYHYESISRGKEDNEEKQKRFNKEIDYMQYSWRNVLKEDKYYNTKLTLNYENFALNINE